MSFKFEVCAFSKIIILLNLEHRSRVYHIAACLVCHKIISIPKILIMHDCVAQLMHAVIIFILHHREPAFTGCVCEYLNLLDRMIPTCTSSSSLLYLFKVVRDPACVAYMNKFIWLNFCGTVWVFTSLNFRLKSIALKICRDVGR